MAQGHRPDRVGDQIREVVAELLARGAVHDPGIGFITLTRVQVSSDLQTAQGQLERYQHLYAVALCDVDHFKWYNDRYGAEKVALLAAVGPLQFEVVQYRLESEYGAPSRLEAAPWTVVRWLPPQMTEENLEALSLPSGSRIAYDAAQQAVVLFPNEWSANYFAQTNPNILLRQTG